MQPHLSARLAQHLAFPIFPSTLPCPASTVSIKAGAQSPGHALCLQPPSHPALSRPLLPPLCPPTVSIETGMQSAAMGYALSTKHFADILVAVPSSVSILVMVWIGAALAVVWRMMPIKDQ